MLRQRLQKSTNDFVYFIDVDYKFQFFVKSLYLIGDSDYM